MAIRKILAPVVGAARDVKVLNSAFAIAKALDAHVSALFVKPDAARSIMYFDPPVPPDVIEAAINAVNEATRNARKIAHLNFEKAAHAAGAMMMSHPQAAGLSCSFMETVGMFAQRVSAYAAFADVVVFGPIGEDEADFSEAFLDTLQQSGCPALMSPNSLPGMPAKVAVGWDGSAAAMRAIKSAMPFMIYADEVHIVMVRKAGEHTPLLQSLKDYLSLHGVRAKEHVVDPADQAIGDRLMQAARDLKADLLVMGGYGQHGHWREAIFGGVTSYVRSHSQLPVLMVH